MTELLEKVISRIRERSPDVQDHAAHLLTDMLDQYDGDYVLTPEQAAKVEQTLAGLKDGSVQRASKDEVRTMWRRFGL